MHALVSALRLEPFKVHEPKPMFPLRSPSARAKARASQRGREHEQESWGGKQGEQVQVTSKTCGVLGSIRLLLKGTWPTVAGVSRRAPRMREDTNFDIMNATACVCVCRCVCVCVCV